MKTQLSVLVCFLALLLALPAAAQVWEEWVATYNGSGNEGDWSQDITIDHEGNPAITGGSTGSGTGLDFLTIKYSAQGQLQWAISFSGAPYADVAYAIDHDDRGNFYVTGKGWGGIPSFYDYVTIKYSSNGISSWIQYYNGPGNYWDTPQSLVVQGENIYVTGEAYTSTGFRAATVRYTSAGLMQWASYYSSPTGEDIGEYVTVNGGDRIAITGHGGSSESNPSGGIITVVYDTSGNQIWSDIYTGDGIGYELGTTVAFDSEGYIIMSGTIVELNSLEDMCVVKYDSSGARMWEQIFNGPGNAADKAYDLVLDCFENVFVAGSSTGAQMNIDFVVIKFNPTGQMQWVYRYNGPSNGEDQAYALAVDELGYVYATGSSYNSGTSLDCFTVKLNSEGTEEWTMRYNGPANGGDEASAIAVDSVWNVFITGYTSVNFQGANFLTIKYAQSVPQNQAPQIIIYEPAELEFVSLDQSVDFWAYAVDPNNDSLLWQWRLDSSVVATDSFCTISFNELGDHQVVCTVSDGELADSVIWEISVLPPNDPPHITSFYPALLDTIMLGSSIEFGASATDPDGDSLLWQWRLDSAVVATDSFCTITFNELGEHQVVCTVSDGQLADSVVWDVTVAALGVNNPVSGIPSSFALYPPHPNPFNAATVICFQLPVASHVKLEISDITGRSVGARRASPTSGSGTITPAGGRSAPTTGWFSAGVHEFPFDGSDLPSGIYICRIEAGDWSAAQKLVLMK